VPEGPPQMEAWQIADFAQLEPGAWGILEPSQPRPLTGPIDLCLTPLLAFSPLGDRIGYGAGHYDRFLASRSDTPAIGLAFEVQAFPWLPSDPHDRRLDAIVTEGRVLRPPQRADAAW
jgi:5-formyltetrahydrofolate cyclo-ligase